MKTDYTHVCVVLDASGSMCSIKDDAVGALTAFCDDQRKKAAEGEKISIDLYQFNYDVKRLAHNASIDELQRYVDAYSCSGSTALYDAVCQGIDELGAFFKRLDESERPESVLFVVVTDGEENSSRFFTSDDVRERVERQRSKYNWVFTYLVNGVDVEEARKNFGATEDEMGEFDRDSMKEHVSQRLCCEMSRVRLNRIASRKPRSKSAD